MIQKYGFNTQSVNGLAFFFIIRLIAFVLMLHNNVIFYLKYILFFMFFDFYKLTLLIDSHKMFLRSICFFYPEFRRKRSLFNLKKYQLRKNDAHYRLICGKES